MSRVIKFLAALIISLSTGSLGLYFGLLLSAYFFCSDRISTVVVSIPICAVDWQTALLTVATGVVLFVSGFIFSFKLFSANRRIK